MGVPDFCARWRAFNALQVAVGAEVSVASLSHRTCPVNYSGLAVANSRSWRVPEAPFLGAERLWICPKVTSLTWSPLVHRTLPGGAPDSPVRQTRGAFGCPFALLLNPILGLFIG
jgi:hypothetical protein